MDLGHVETHATANHTFKIINTFQKNKEKWHCLGRLRANVLLITSMQCICTAVVFISAWQI